MVSSSKGSRPPPDTPAPEGRLNPTPGGGTPWFPSVLNHDDPSAMATGLTKQMFTPPADAAQPPPGAAIGGSTAAGSPSSGASAAALARLSPGARQAYEQAMAAGDSVEAARILLSAQMMNQGPQINTADQSQSRQFGSSGGGYGGNSGIGRGGGGNRAGLGAGFN